MKKSRVGVLVFLVFCLPKVWAQESTNASGGEASGSSGVASYTVGQVFYTTNSSDQRYESQGVQQVYEFSFAVNNKEIAKDLGLKISVYPNPVKDKLVVDIAEAHSEKGYMCSLYTVKGVLIHTYLMNTTKTEISMKNLPSSTYILKVMKDDKNKSAIQTITIIKK